MLIFSKSVAYDVQRANEYMQSIITCDRCHEQISTDRTALAVSCGPHAARPPIDLCPGCMAGLLDWLNAATAGPSSIGAAKAAERIEADGAC